MKNKLLLTSALVGLVAVSGAHAETKISGNMEQTWKNISDDANSGAASTEGFGTELNIGLSSSSELDNGMSTKFGFNLETDPGNGGAAENDAYYLTIGLNDVASISFAQDNGTNLSGSAVPHISDTASTVVGGGYHNLGVGASDGHNDMHIRTDINAAGGALTLRYVPNDGQSSNSQSSAVADESANSAYDVIYKGSLGVDGLTVLAGVHKAEQNSIAGTDAQDTKFKKYGIAYNFGQFSVGVERQESEVDGSSTGELDEKESDSFGITYAVNDKVSLGLAYYETEFTDAGVKDAQEEEITMIGLGYSLGGLAIDVNYAMTENYNFGTTDRDTLQIRTIQKF